ncbi:glycosyltransferase family 4 protein [Mariniflexile sp.]|uniref:glycosyltransferase family 4 protein n=1 Tax=Mariniflexile sp. TaxID=1979402 RepID=UPI0040474DBB
MAHKILYITNGISGPGGLERVLSIKASYLAEKFGYKVHIITLNQGGASLFYDFSKKIEYHDIRVDGKIFEYYKKYRKGIKSTIKQIQPDIISVCDDGLKGFFIPYIIGKNCPMIYERHASKNIFKNRDQLRFFQNFKFKVLNKLMHFGARKYDAFVVLTNDNLTEWSLNNLKVIPNPLSFYPKAKATLINKKIIAVGNHGFQKGYDRLLLIWKSVINKHPDWQLEVYGKIDKEKKHIKLAEKLEISDNVLFYEPVKNIEVKYKGASIYVLSSRSEGFGMVLIEAMACGLPCVAFDCPCGPKDIITDGEDGFLIQNGNINEFAEKLNALIENQELRFNLSAKARINAKNYLPNVIVPQWDKLFKSLLAIQ